ETLRALDDLVRAGKILHPAVSNWAAWQIAKALGVSALHGWARFACMQPMYNLVKRQAEVEILPLALSEGLGVIPYSPLGGGLLSGKYAPGRKPKHGRLVNNKMYDKRFSAPWYYEAAAKLAEHARRRGVHPATLAVAWVMSHPAVTAPIIGARDVAQLLPSLRAAELPLPPAERLQLSRLTPQPPPATDRLEEQAPA
ncbi:MAG: aldo/keto reductase, partial [bacterium]